MMSKPPCGQFAYRCYTCRPRPTCTFRSATPEYERQFLMNVRFLPIPSLRGHLAGAGNSQDENAFLNAAIQRFLN